MFSSSLVLVRRIMCNLSKIAALRGVSAVTVNVFLFSPSSSGRMWPPAAGCATPSAPAGRPSDSFSQHGQTTLPHGSGPPSHCSPCRRHHHRCRRFVKGPGCPIDCHIKVDRLRLRQTCPSRLLARILGAVLSSSVCSNHGSQAVPGLSGAGRPRLPNAYTISTILHTYISA